jgi:hypothetical protein
MRPESALLRSLRNSRSGSQVGRISQLHFYLDDLFPTTIGRSLFGK